MSDEKAKEKDQSKPRDMIERAALCLAELLDALPAGGSITPNQLAQAAGGDPRERLDWRKYLRAGTAAARRLEADGVLVALRKGKPVALSDAKGVIKYARASDFPPVS